MSSSGREKFQKVQTFTSSHVATNTEPNPSCRIERIRILITQLLRHCQHSVFALSIYSIYLFYPLGTPCPKNTPRVTTLIKIPYQHLGHAVNIQTPIYISQTHLNALLYVYATRSGSIKKVMQGGPEQVLPRLRYSACFTCPSGSNPPKHNTTILHQHSTASIVHPRRYCATCSGTEMLEV